MGSIWRTDDDKIRVENEEQLLVCVQELAQLKRMCLEETIVNQD